MSRFRKTAAILLLALACGAGLYTVLYADGGTADPAIMADSTGGQLTQARSPAGPEIAGSPVPSDVPSPAPASNLSISSGNPDPSAPPASVTAQKQAAVANPRLGSSLAGLTAVQEASGEAAARDLAASQGMTVKDGGVQVVIEAAAGDTAAAEDAARAKGARVETTSGRLVQAVVPIASLKALAADPAVAKVRQPLKPVPAAVTSEGVADIGANTWQTGGQTGAGVKVAVLDGGFSGYDARIAGGDLPAGTIVHSERSDGDITGGGDDHGTACAEIIYDVAPGVTMYLVNFGTEVELANAVNYLIGQGVKVISASWSFPGSNGNDGNGAIDDLVVQFNGTGGVWVNAAGNGAQSHWGGVMGNQGRLHYMTFSGSDINNRISLSAGETVTVFLTWNEWPLSANDYDLFLVTSGGTPVASSEYLQDGGPNSQPSEALQYTSPAGGNYDIRVLNYSANGQAIMDLFTYPVDLLSYKVPAGSIMGPPADSPYAVTVGAVAVGTNNLEAFSSQGPTRAGRVKPDVAGPDRVTTATYGFTGFAGTSASAPHAAGTAALVKGAYPTWSAASVRNMIGARATDLGTAGKDNLFGDGKLRMGNLPVFGGAHYLFSWYDQYYAGMKDWFIAANPSDTQSVTAQAFVGPEFQWEYTIGPGAIVTPQYPGIIGGPLDAVSVESRPLLSSQRVLYNGNFTETPSVRETDLASDYYLAWYDENSLGMRSWVMVANRGSATANVEIYIHGALMATYNIAPGDRVAPEFWGVLDGPVRVVSTNGQSLVVSERVTYLGSFSETLAVPASRLGDEYRFAWYDQQSPGMKTWVLAANPGAAPVTAEVYLGGVLAGTYDIPAGGEVTPQFDGQLTGPVRVRSTGGEPLIVSERSTYGASFEEVMGVRPADLGTTSWFTWYDQLSAGMKTWILMSNQGAGDATADIYIAGAHAGGPYILPADGSTVVATFPGVMSGPVKVVSGGQPVLVSERTVYNSSFNEITGMAP